MVKEGYDPKSKEFFVELDRRIAKRFPELYARKAPKNMGGAPAGTGAATSTRSAVGKRTIKLQKSDLIRMQKFGLDPQNKAHLQEWARSKGAA